MGSHRDVFPDVPALKSRLKEKRDYRIRIRYRSAFATIVSPHGGYIEEGTSALARACAGPDLNFFDFQGLRTNDPQELHVTSTRFRDPELMKMLAASELAVSIHGMGDEDDMTIWLGGLNKELKESMLKALLANGFLVDPDSPRHRGESNLNFVNMAKQKGVQIELPNNLLKTMFVGPRKFAPTGRCIKTTPIFDKFVKAVRQVVHAEKRRLKKLNASNQ
ncbi:MAG: poly-gamma-glutamate hydrolase family protein [Candidatus Melainabacteria bacterium]|nr:poly-gamma-glutamate hydrolase family protein [Candidatus Melainabacteria bacterium]